LGSDSLLDALRSVALSAGFSLKAILNSAIRSSGLFVGAKPVGSTFFKAARSSFLLPVISCCGVSSKNSVVSLVPDSGVIAPLRLPIPPARDRPLENLRDGGYTEARAPGKLLDENLPTGKTESIAHRIKVTGLQLFHSL